MNSRIKKKKKEYGSKKKEYGSKKKSMDQKKKEYGFWKINIELQEFNPVYSLYREKGETLWGNIIPEMVVKLEKRV